ncbi:MAG: phosphate ABC transporter permease PstA [Deltaproteobacteria bacterium]|nr:MAG: phosphate ABC transporter permease PstA [Deltaproteobacteria bacterium]
MNPNVIKRNERVDLIFKWVAILSTILAISVLAALLIDVLSDGAGRLSWKFLTSFPSRRPARAGILSAIVGTFVIMGLTAAVSIPVGVAAAIYLEEYARKNWFTRLVELNIANLASVPSIIYGLLGLGVFVRAMDLERSILSGALTLALLILPIIIISSREALKAVPFSIREASYSLGATRWQTTKNAVLPAAMPGIMTGTILALSRAIGETAPLITIGALTYIAFLPTSPISVDGTFPFIHLSFEWLKDPFTVLPIQIFNWVSRPQKAFLVNAAAAIIVLLAITLLLNAAAVYIRYRFRRTWK